MAIVTLDYAQMRESAREADKAAKSCMEYAEQIESKICRRLNSLPMGGNGNTSQADYFARKKIAKLNEKREDYEKFAGKMREAESYAKRTDKNVSNYIRDASTEFRNSHDMKTNIILEFFTWSTTTLLNATSFGRWLNQIGRTLHAWVDTAKRTFREFFELNGGKYMAEVVMGVLGLIFFTVSAVAAFAAFIAVLPALFTAIAGFSLAGLGVFAATLWTTVTTAAAFVGAVAAVENSIVKIAGNAKAASEFEDDPGWAKRHSSYASLPEFLKKHNFQNSTMDKLSMKAAKIIDGVHITADLINVANVAKQGIRAIKKIKMDPHTAARFSKVNFRLKNGKVTMGSVKYGLKHLQSNIKEMKNLVSGTNSVRLNKYYKQYIPWHSKYEQLQSVNKRLTSWNKSAQTFGKKGLQELVSENTKEKLKKAIKSQTVVYDLVLDPGKKAFDKAYRWYQDYYVQPQG